ncbi:MAG: D-alanyl-D-alanine carboxypeptidase [Clostridia bacterium]|nr:D-alanyl-D-alanine carboxypeptidase [Clostridia bacterium]
MPLRKYAFIRISTLFLALIFAMLSLVLPAQALSLSAQSAVLIDARDGRVLYEKDADTPRPMASTTKIMTAVVALESCDVSEIIEIADEAVGVEGSSIYLQKGERMTLLELLYALLLQSANDAAVAIAVGVGGSVGNFADMMNEKATSLGLTSTHFENPNGLDADGHVTTARELALLTAYALKNPIFAEIVATYKRKISGPNGTVRLVVNHNKLLNMYDGCVGVKTGFTKKSGRCLVSAACRESLTLVSVTLSAPDDWRDHTAMLNYGYENYCCEILCDEGGFIEALPVVGGVQDSLLCANCDYVAATLPRDHGEITVDVQLPQMIYAPVSAGDIVGHVTYKCDGKVIGETDIKAAYNIEQIKFKKNFWQKVWDFVTGIFS